MLKSILNDTRLNSKISFSIILIPPHNTQLPQDTTDLYNFLSSHVIHIPWNTSLTQLQSRLSLQNKRVEAELLRMGKKKKYQQLLVSMNDIIYSALNEQVNKAHILRSELLYTIPNRVICTHLVLYLDRPIIDSSPTSNINKFIQDSNFNDMIQRRDTLDHIDALARQFCDNSIECESLSSLRTCIKHLLNEGYQWIDTSVPTTSELNLDSAYESYVMDLTYDVLFFKITQLLLPQDTQLGKALESMEYIDFSQIGLPASIQDERTRVKSAISIFERIGSFRTPAEKMDCLLSTVSKLTTTENQASSILNSDSLIPLLLMTLVQSKVPHLTANLVYMKDYTFERDIVTGKYAYALSTLEGVLEYILSSSADLSALSAQNARLWSAIQRGDVAQVTRCDTHVRDRQGNTALMVACLYGHPSLVQYLLSIDPYARHTNDGGSTPLMYAIQSNNNSNNRLHTVQVLLQNQAVQDTIDATDHAGNTALLYACATNDPVLVDTLLGRANIHITNTRTHDSVLHVAVRNHCSTSLLSLLLRTTHPALQDAHNARGESVYHVCEDRDLLLFFLDQHNDNPMRVVTVQCCGVEPPCLTWVAKGRLDLFEMALPYIQSVPYDHQGRNVLHFIAQQQQQQKTYGQLSMAFLVERFQKGVRARDWVHGNTPLHVAARLAPTQEAMAFVKALVDHGACLDAINFNDEYPVDRCTSPEMMALFDEMHLEACLPEKQNHCQYVWAVTRAVITRDLKDGHSNMYCIIKSRQIGKPESMRAVRRSVHEFTMLRKGLLHELPETFLPTFKELAFPELLDLHPPPHTVVHSTLQKLQSFMAHLQSHPILRTHDLVLSFVRSSVNLQHAVIRDTFSSRRQLILEKMNEWAPVASLMNETYFLEYIEEMLKPLKRHLQRTIVSGRKFIHVGLELNEDMRMMTQSVVCLEETNTFSPLVSQTVKTCVRVALGQGFVSPWSSFSRTTLFSYSMIDGIMLSLKRPHSLIQEREALVQNIEKQKELLKKHKHWQHIFTIKRIDEDKTKLVENINQLNHLDSQIHQSHRIISDELAHFQTVHPKQMMKAVRNFAKLSLASEKHTLDVLSQTLAEWETNDTCFSRL